MKILFIQVEFANFDHSLPWTYYCHMGIAESLKQAGHDVDVVFTHQMRRLDALSREGDYDLVMVNDVQHGFFEADHFRFALPEAPVQRLRARGMPVLGFLVESVFPDHGAMHTSELDKKRLQVVERMLPQLDFVVSYDLHDAEVMRQRGAAALWAPFCSARPPLARARVSAGKITFFGSLYKKRVDFVDAAKLRDRINAGFIDYPPEVAEKFRIATMGLMHPGPPAVDAYALLREVKETVFRIYAENLLGQPVVLNLPTMFRGISCRTVEALALGLPSLSPRPRHPGERALLATFPVRACVLYDEGEPAAFGALLEDAVANPLSGSEQVALQSRFERSPFTPAAFASNLVAFASGQRPAAQIEAGYV